MAPKLIKLPEIPSKFIMAIVKSIESGMTEATIKPARKEPKKKIKTNKTMSAPSKRFVLTVAMALSTKWLRSKKGEITRPLGRLACISFIFSFTCTITFEALAPLSINTTPPTTSPSVSRVKAP